MKRELGIARCGLACCLCAEHTNCKGCHAEDCAGKEWCENRHCSMEKGLSHCFICVEQTCRKGILQKEKPHALTVFARKYGVDVLLDCLEKNETNGILYHRTGIIGHYDNKTMEEVFNLLLNGATARDS